jgi:hypothetical protein
MAADLASATAHQAFGHQASPRRGGGSGRDPHSNAGGQHA